MEKQNTKVVEKTYPEVGDKLYLSQETGSYYVDLVKHPYTVICVEKDAVVVQEASLIFYGDRYYDTLADEIRENPRGEVKILRWGNKRGAWMHKSHTGDRYPEIAHFGEWEYYPYLD